MRNPAEDALPSLVWECSTDGLIPALRDAVEAAVAAYAVAGTGCVRVTSAMRSLRAQARLMAGMTPEQWQRLYAANGMPDYIAALLEHSRRHGPPDPDQVYRILCARREGYISAHLFGAALDIAAVGLDVTALQAVLRDRGLRVLDETDAGIPCLHVSLPGTEPVIVRE
jgi:hypothetical protein